MHHQFWSLSDSISRETSSGIAKCRLFSRATFDTLCHLPFQWLLLDLQIFFIIHCEIAGDPWNLIGSQHCDLFPNHTIFCSKSRHSFSTCKLTSCLIKSHLFALYCIISVLGTKILRCESLFVSALRWESLFVSTGSNKYWYWLNSMISKWL